MRGLLWLGVLLAVASLASAMCPAGHFYFLACIQCNSPGSGTGYYCPGGAFRQSCSCGHKCPNVGQENEVECPAGRYAESRKSSCSACPQHHYCPDAGTCEPTKCLWDHEYTGTGATSDSVCQECPAGQWSYSGSHCRNCPEGTHREVGSTGCSDCPGGFYCTSGAKTTCPAGYYCPSGSSSPTACGGHNKFCPEGSSSPQTVSSGWYSAPVADPSDKRPLERICQIGRYCSSGKRFECTAGRYAPEEGSSGTCPETCSSGHYCPEGSSFEVVCVAGKYAGSGSGSCTDARIGHFVDDDEASSDDPCPVRSTTTSTGQTSCHACPAGYYCPGGVRQKCPGGRYTSATNRASASECTECPGGHYCEEGATTTQQCGSTNKYCPAGSSSAQDVPSGHYSTPISAHGSQRTGHTACEAGYQCINGVRSSCPRGKYAGASSSDCTDCTKGAYCLEGSTTPTACPGGRYSNSEGNDHADDCQSCPVGHFCGASGGTILPTPCTDVRSYCDGADAAAIPATSGHYTVLTDSLRTGQLQAPKGKYALSGALHSCPQGRYGETVGLASESCSGFCTAGYYCPAESQTPTAQTCGHGASDPQALYCPAGTTSRQTVGDGYYSTPESSSVNLRTNRVHCQQGYWCKDGLRTQCPAGSYGATKGLSTIACSGLCSPGHWCGIGSTSSTQTPCIAGRYSTASGNDNADDCQPCPEGFWCGSGTGNPNPCSTPPGYCAGQSNVTPKTATSGFYTIPETANRIAEQQCVAGEYCSGGARAPCPAGRYGSTPGLATKDCTGPCQAGHYCPPGSIVIAPEECGGTGTTYCPSGTASRLTAAAGLYTLPEGAGLTVREDAEACPAGWYCLGDGFRLACPEGSYGSSTGLLSAACTAVCPAGRYGSTTGQETADCNGPCTAGYYCPAESTSATQEACGGTGDQFCPGGIPSRQTVATGSYTVPEAADVTLREAEVTCPEGWYCSGDGFRRQCPGGRYGSTTGLVVSACSGPCDEGHWCGDGSTSRTENECPAGTFSGAKGNDKLSDCEDCPKGSWCGGATVAPPDCPAGRYGDVLRLETADCTGPCPLGFFCPAGAVGPTPCPEGTYGNVTELSMPACAGVCPPGYFCLAATATGGTECGGNHVYCPPASSSPTLVVPGQYSVGGAPTTRSSSVDCPPGSWCSSGVATLCPSGRYGNVGLLSDPLCSGGCPVGHYCGIGTADPEPCWAPTSYCPALSVSPTDVDVGFYTMPEDEPRERQVPAQPGHYAEGGVHIQCPAGTFGNETKLGSAACSGGCLAGFYCPIGSTAATQLPCADPLSFCPPSSGSPTLVSTGFFTIPEDGNRESQTGAEPGHYAFGGVHIQCPAGRYGEAGELASPACSGPCSATFYCPIGSASASQVPCGDASVFCPVGSGQPVPVRPGFYTLPLLGNRSSETAADPGWYADQGVHIQCAGGTFNPSPQRSSPCSSLCPPGFVCPPGTVTPVTRCESPTEYCPEGSASPSLTPAGMYAVTTSDGLYFGVEPCLPGWTCSGGVRSQCPAGRFTNVSLETSPTCLGDCSAGYYCPLGSSSATQEACGSTALVCPSGTPSRVPVPVGHLSEPHDGSLVHRTHFVACPPGSWCSQGNRTVCPGGRYGNVSELSSPSCSGPCSASFYCPPGSASSTQVPCGPPSLYCPGESAEPLVAPNGTFTVESRSITPCPPGLFCFDGVATLCPAGRYGCSSFIDDPGCNGECDEGFFCLEGSTSNQENSCGSPSVYCPSGSSVPTEVSIGYYSLGGATPDRHPRETECEPGTYCVNGTRSLCPPGRYGSTSLLTTALCSGVCADGYKCDAGSTSQTEAPCPAGYVCANGDVTPCPAGTYLNTTHNTDVSQCVACPPSTASSVVGSSWLGTCVPCVRPEDSLAGAAACLPGLLSVTARSPPPVVVGLSPGDQLVFEFTRPTLNPSPSEFLELTASIGGPLSHEWINGSHTLVVTVTDTASADPNPDTYEIGALNVSVTSTELANRSMAVVGTWGVPTPPEILRVEANNTGGSQWVEAGDSLLLTFDQEVLPVPCCVGLLELSSTAESGFVDGVLADVVQDLEGTWVNRTTILLTLTSWTHGRTSELEAAMDIGALTVTVLEGGGLVSFNRQSEPSFAVARLSEGSWGDAPSVVPLPNTASSLRVELHPPPLIRVPVTRYVVQWSSSGSFDGMFDPETWAEVDAGVEDATNTLSVAASPYVDVRGLEPGVTYWFRARCTNAEGRLGPWPDGVAPRLAPVGPVIHSVAAPSGHLASEGGDAVVLVGEHLGRIGASVAVTYTNGEFVFNATECEHVVEFTSVVCLSAAGVGVGYRFAIQVDGEWSGYSSLNGTLAYQPPTVSGFEGNGSSLAMTNGGEIIEIYGRNFGPASLSAIEAVTATAIELEGASFDADPAQCFIVEDHVHIRCVTPAGVGRLLTWSVVVASQQSSAPFSRYARPVIREVGVEGVDGVYNASYEALQQLPTRGGLKLVIHGDNFGEPGTGFLESVTATSTVPGVPSLEAVGCVVADPHHRIECTTPAGVGYGFRWSVVVADQVSVDGSGQTWSFAPPSIASVSVSDIPTKGGDTVAVSGHNFGPTADGVVLMGRIGDAVESVVLSGVRMVPTATEDVFVFPSPEGEGRAVVLSLTVGTQAPATAMPELLYQFPVVERLAVVTPDGEDPPDALECDPVVPTVFATLHIKGRNFGAGDRTNVTIDDTPCVVNQSLSSHENLYCVTAECAGPLTVSLLAAEDHTTTVPYRYEDLIQPPELTRFEPRNSGPTSGGTVVRLKGASFKDTGKVWFSRPGESRRECVWEGVEDGVYTSSEIVCVTPPGTGVGHNVQLTARSVVSNILTWNYIAPSVTSVSPSVVDPSVAFPEVTVKGVNFGLSRGPAERDFVTVGGLLCDPVVLWNDTHIRCMMPAVAPLSVGVKVSLDGQSSVVGSGIAGVTAVTIRPPRVLGVSPSTGLTSGGAVLTVRGQWFAWSLAVRVWLRRSVASTEGQLACNVLTANATHIQCLSPVGAGAGWRVVVENVQAESGSAVSELPDGTPASQFSVQPGVFFNYIAPMVDSVGVETGAGAVPAVGGFVVVINGSSLSLSPSVTIAGEPCTILPSGSHFQLRCVAPPRRVSVGDVPAENVLVVSASGLVSEEVEFLYDPPSVVEIVPNTIDAALRSVATSRQFVVRGFNFGVTSLDNSQSVHTVEAGPLGCNHVWTGDGSIVCVPLESVVVGPYNVTVTLHGVTSALTQSSVVYTECRSGMYGREGELCLDCPPGATCLGQREDPRALPGFYPEARDKFPACHPTDACVGYVDEETDPCSTAYTGVRCSECALNHYRLQGRCEPCPNHAWLLFVGLFVILVCAVGASVWLTRRRINLAGLSIGVDFMQVVAMFASFDFAWPPAIRTVYSSLSLTSFNIELVAPECSLSVDYTQKWFLMQLLPVALAGMAIVVYSVSQLLYFGRRRSGKCFRAMVCLRLAKAGQRDAPRSMRVVDASIGVTITGLYYLFFVVVRNALAPFDCVEDESGVSVMDMEPSVRCDEPGGPHETILPWATITLLVYGAGIPIGFGVALWSRRRSIKADQSLRERGEGGTEATNPHWNTRQRFRKLYEDFNSERYYWKLWLICRKLMLAVTAIMFNQNPMFQASLTIAVLFLAYGLHTQFTPFLLPRSVSKALVAVTQRRRRANRPLSLAPLRATDLEQDSDMDASDGAATTEVKSGKPKAKRKTPSRRQSHSRLVQASLKARSALVAYAFNYNTLESVFLVTAMGILLGGMIFSSSAFEPGQPEYDALTVIVTVGIVGSVVVFVSMLLFEVYRAVKFSSVFSAVEAVERKAQEKRNPLSVLDSGDDKSGGPAAESKRSRPLQKPVRAGRKSRS